MPVRALVCALAASVIQIAAGRAATTGTETDVQLFTPPGFAPYQYQVQSVYQMMYSASNVYYDESLDCIPLKAYNVTDANGGLLGPFVIEYSDYSEMVLDVRPLLTDDAPKLKPFFKGTELTAASDRAWRWDWYKNGFAAGPYSTLMSGSVNDLGGGEYKLTVHLGLHWSKEGDNLNRLGQGTDAHIALALADFQSLNLTIESLGAARVKADVIKATTTTTAPATAPTTTTTTTTTSAGQDRAATTTEEPADRETDGEEDKIFTSGSSYYTGGKKGKKGRKSGKGGKKGKKGKGKLAEDSTQGPLGSASSGAAAALVILGCGAALVAIKKRQARQEQEHEYASLTEEDTGVPEVARPMQVAPLRVYGAFENLAEAAKLMHIPPPRSPKE